ncbi:unnamed protein product [Scytosiphon promiscuus]
MILLILDLFFFLLEGTHGIIRRFGREGGLAVVFDWFQTIENTFPAALHSRWRAQCLCVWLGVTCTIAFEDWSSPCKWEEKKQQQQSDRGRKETRRGFGCRGKKQEARVGTRAAFLVHIATSRHASIEAGCCVGRVGLGCVKWVEVLVGVVGTDLCPVCFGICMGSVSFLCPDKMYGRGVYIEEASKRNKRAGTRVRE